MFLVQKLISAALLPSALLVECVMLGLLLGRRAGRALVWAGASAGVFCLLLPVESWMLTPLENRFPQVNEPPPRVDGVIVLGGAIDDLTSADHGTPSLNEAANRLTTFAMLARRYPAARMVFTGGSAQLVSNARPGAQSEADFSRELLESIGLPPGRVIYEDRSLTTVQNATFTRDLVHPATGEVWLLVTSAAHMPRAVGVFQRAGWPVVAWPTGYHGRTGLLPWSRPFGAKLALLDAAAHEWVGLATYWATGKTSALFPAPSPP